MKYEDSLALQAQQILERYPLERKYFDKTEIISQNEVRPPPHCCYCEDSTWVIDASSNRLNLPEPLCRKHFLLKCLSEHSIRAQEHSQKIIQELTTMGLDTEFRPVCKWCGILLTDENWTPANQLLKHYYCKKCLNEYALKWRTLKERR